MIAPNGKVHPVGAMFPMISDEELDELAADIKANGLLNPIVLDADGTLIDGRNRLEACKRAGVKPAFTLLDGKEAISFIFSENIFRRHLNQGQRAILLASVLFDSNNVQIAIAKQLKISQPIISRAKMIKENAPDLADEIIVGRAKFEPSYQEAKNRKAEKDRNEANQKRLQTESPELWALVQDENDPMTLDGAIIELDRQIKLAAEKAEQERIEKEESRRRARALYTEWICDLSVFDPGKRDPRSKAKEMLENCDQKAAALATDLSPERYQRIAKVVQAIAEGLTK